MEKKSNSPLDIRRLLKRRKPKFLRQDGHKKVRLGNKWRKPKGIQNKVRLSIRGYRRKISVGFKSPRSVRGYDKSGLKSVLVENIKQLQSINPKEEGIVLKRTVGTKNKIIIIKKAEEMEIKVLNIKDTKAYVKTIENNLNKKKTEKEKLKKQKEDKKAKQKKESEKKKKAKKEKTDDEKIKEGKEKKAAEKKEKDKLLIKRNIKGN